MNDFTLSTLLSIVKDNLLKTIGLFILTFIAISNIPIFTEKYEQVKFIVLDNDPDLHRNLKKNEIRSLLSSDTFRQILIAGAASTDIADYEIKKNVVRGEDSIVKVIFRASNKDTILLTSKMSIGELKKINLLRNSSIILGIKEKIDSNNLLIEYISSIETTTDEYEKLLRDDVVELEKIQNMRSTYQQLDTSLVTHDGIMALTRDKREASKVSWNLNLYKTDYINVNLALNKIVDRYNSSQGVSYLLPSSENSISMYFPNVLVYSGVSIFISVLYNLFMISLIFTRRKG